MHKFVMGHASFLILLLLFSWGCHKKQSVPIAAPTRAEAPPPAVTPPPTAPAQPAPVEPPPVPKTIAPPSSFDLGELSFQQAKYAEAAGLYEAFLRDNPKSKDRDIALFNLGISRALAGDSSRNLIEAEAAFKRLISESPKSPYRGQAELILGFHAQIEKLKSDVKERDEKIKRLSEELQKLKDIDMQRRPSRPPE